MRTRVLVVAATTLTITACCVVGWILARPDFARPVGMSGATPQWSNLIAPVAWTATGAVLARIRPGNRVALLLLGVGVCQAVSQASAVYGTYGAGIADPQWPVARWVAEFGTPLWIPGRLPLFGLLLAIYPDGRLPGRAWRVPVLASILGMALLTYSMTGRGAYDDIVPGAPPLELIPPTPVKAVLVIVMAASFLGGTAAIWTLSIRRLLRAPAPERQQLAWLLCAVIPLFVLDFVNPWRTVGVVLTLSVPIAIAVGVVRYRLLGITVVLRRSLVYAVLTGVVLLVYLAISAIVGTRLGSGSVAGVVAAGLVVLGLAPLRERLQIQIDRLVYGERRDPMRAVTRFADSVAAAAEPGDLLPTVLAIVTSAVRAPGATVETPDGRVLATHGTLDAGECLPLQFGGAPVGTLRVSARNPSEQYTDGDRRLLSALARQVAVVVRAIDLAETLEAERDRVVNATKTERDRLRRDLHDGLGPSLAGLGLGLEAIETAIARQEQTAAIDLVMRVRAEAGTAVAEVRRILDDLRPAALDDAGLVAALQRHIQAAGAGLAVGLDVTSPLPPLSPDLETTAYRIAREALTNVVRHADATTARIGVHVVGDNLRVEIFDDGIGLDHLCDEGVGLTSMRHRAEALGGTLTITARRPGTTVVACLPLEPAPTVVVRP